MLNLPLFFLLISNSVQTPFSPSIFGKIFKSNQEEYRDTPDNAREIPGNTLPVLQRRKSENYFSATSKLPALSDGIKMMEKMLPTSNIKSDCLKYFYHYSKKCRPEKLHDLVNVTVKDIFSNCSEEETFKEMTKNHVQASSGMLHSLNHYPEPGVPQAYCIRYFDVDNAYKRMKENHKTGCIYSLTELCPGEVVCHPKVTTTKIFQVLKHIPSLRNHLCKMAFLQMHSKRRTQNFFRKFNGVKTSAPRHSEVSATRMHYSNTRLSRPNFIEKISL